ncbi:hypothetical protein P3T76_010475 [Phytophthora citrophthora]|uniref:Uncharacterized protein n=1 Tax=Phytophthora citrophthora TaxID=4793 RepID=A0AAD9LGM0_9STRA|nr:hypothetical protein P3T76_010475 [Phytophthora citrophthora]
MKTLSALSIVWCATLVATTDSLGLLSPLTQITNSAVGTIVGTVNNVVGGSSSPPTTSPPTTSPPTTSPPSTSSPPYGPISKPFQKVTSLHARVQGDMPQWNSDNQRFVSTYYTTFDEKYRAVLDTVNMAAVEGALKYVQAECINSSVVTNCRRKNNIKYVVFYQTTVVQPSAAMEYYAQATNEYDFAIERCPFLPMDGGQCNPKADGSYPDECNQYSGTNGQPDLGFCVGGSLQDNEAIAPYPYNYWFSFPNSCPLNRWSAKTETCRSEYPGGMCPLGVEPDGETCTFKYEVLGYIPLDDVVGITSMVNPNTGLNYADYSEFCTSGGVEFSVSVAGDQVTWIDGLDFWENPGDSTANAARAEKVVAAYCELVARDSSTSDGGVMKPLPTVAELTAMNPPCFENSQLCAEAEFGCKRLYRSQICRVCTANDSGCVKPGL